MTEPLCDWQSFGMMHLCEIQEDERFEFAFGRSVDDLTASIARFGLSHPIIVWGPDKIVVDGHLRAVAARMAGLAAAPAVRLRESATEREAFGLALDAFLAAHAPNPVEMSRVVNGAAKIFPREEIIESILPRLGLQPALVMYQRYKDIACLPGAALCALAEGTLDASSVAQIDLLEPEDRKAAIDLIVRLRPSKSLQKELLENLYDVCKRDEISVADLLSEYDASAKPDGADANIPEQRDAFRQWLHRRRFPTLSAREREFEEISRRLAPGRDIRIQPPPFFEGRRIEVRFAFDSREAWQSRFAALKGMNEKIDLLDDFLR